MILPCCSCRFALLILIITIAQATTQQDHHDILVYGATPAGIAAAIAAAASSNSSRVLLVEPTFHVGGMTTEGGIGLRDGFDWLKTQTQVEWGMLNAKHYNSQIPIWQPDNFVGEASFLKQLQKHQNIKLMFNTMLAGVQVSKNGGWPRITKVALNDTTNWISVSYVIDASYEGDVVLASNVVSYTFGRESTQEYNESLAGITATSEAQFKVPVSPFDRHGLLKYVAPSHRDVRQCVGEADDKNVMAYSYRVCLTQDPNNFVNVTPPANYDPKDFELAQRLLLAELQANVTPSQPWAYLHYSNYEYTNKSLKYDACCGQSPVGIDATGLAVGYQTGSFEKRQEIANRIRYYVQGLMWFWQSDPTVPLEIRKQHAEYGLCKDEWEDNGHFPRQLYVREAIRLVGDNAFTQHDRMCQECREDSIAVAAWGLDIHDMQRVAVFDSDLHQWIAFNEGLTPYNNGGYLPFEIPYYTLLPKRDELGNLAVPNCPSVSHVAFSAIREEPTLWLLGQAAGTAAAIALSTQSSLHSVNVRKLQDGLLQQGSYIHWPPTPSCLITKDD